MSVSSEAWEKLGIIGTLVTLGGLGFRWLIGEIKMLRNLLDESYVRERQLRETQAETLLEQAQLLSQSSQVVRDALSDVTGALERLEREVANARKSP